VASRLVLSVQFDDDVLTVTYGEMFDNGLASERALNIPKGSDYDDEIAAVQDAVDSLLDDAIEDSALMTPIDTSQYAQSPDERDRELGPGDPGDS